ncbi:hypothetical protein SBOR_0126 [Sclerotinia borealis F-4128]|uniref:Uncharacterized protein n=1 Tax=Sclerotinia borealis (strain F-4128) TaxID=1432307 RepID=W9CUI0_SCLBF|nr:hypothetical protein SBOR_0126 [Sclerotinia borealis F-4128]
MQLQAPVTHHGLEKVNISMFSRKVDIDRAILDGNGDIDANFPDGRERLNLDCVGRVPLIPEDSITQGETNLLFHSSPIGGRAMTMTRAGKEVMCSGDLVEFIEEILPNLKGMKKMLAASKKDHQEVQEFVSLVEDLMQRAKDTSIKNASRVATWTYWQAKIDEERAEKGTIVTKKQAAIDESTRSLAEYIPQALAEMGVISQEDLDEILNDI